MALEMKSLHHVDSVNIENYPALDKNYPFDKGAQLTLGDLHGNTLKLFYTLVRHGVITNVSKEDYINFNRLYKRTADEISAADLQWFHKLIAKIKVNGKGTLRLIGDDLADRGANDYFTLALLAKLIKNTHVEILVSNHSLEFIRAFEKGTPYISPNLLFGQAASMQNLQQLIQRKLITRYQVDTLFANEYMPQVKLLSYTLDAAHNKIAIFSHAPIGIDCMQAIAAKMGVAFKDNSPQELAQTIESINKIFNEKYVKTNTVHTLFDSEIYANEADADPKTAPFTHLIWNRNHNVNRPAKYKGYNIKWIHGHDARPTNILHKIYNLDNNLGKGINAVEGAYNVHYTHEKQLGAPRVFIENDEGTINDDDEMSLAPSISDTVKDSFAAFKDTFFAPSKHPLIAGALAAIVAVAVSATLALTTLHIIVCGAFAALTIAASLKAKDSYAQMAAQKNIATHLEPEKKNSFAQGVEAANGWLPYAKSHFSLSTWKEPRSFAAGMESKLKKPSV